MPPPRAPQFLWFILYLKTSRGNHGSRLHRAASRWADGTAFEPELLGDGADDAFHDAVEELRGGGGGARVQFAAAGGGGDGRAEEKMETAPSPDAAAVADVALELATKGGASSPTASTAAASQLQQPEPTYVARAAALWLCSTDTYTQPGAGSPALGSVDNASSADGASVEPFDYDPATIDHDALPRAKK